jgi:hypothetical protein
MFNVLVVFAKISPDAPTSLRVEHLATPLIGMDVAQPRFTWMIPTSSQLRGQFQTSYEVCFITKRS